MTKVSTLIRQLAKEGHKLASLEKASVLSASDDPKDQDKAREIRTRHDYESLKRQISSKKKPSKPAVEEEVVNETTMPNVSSNDKKAIKSRAKNLFKRDLKGQHDSVNETVSGGVPMTPQELEIQKKMSRLNVRLARKRSQEMQKAKVKDTEVAPEQVKEGDVHSGQGEKIQKRTKAWMDKKGQKGAPGLDAIRARTAEHKAKRGVKEDWKPEIEHSKLGDAKKKVDKKRESKLPPHLQGDAIGKMKKAFSEEDKAFNYVVDKLRKQYGKDSVLTKGQKPKPPTDKQKAEYAAHKKKIAQQDPRDPTEKASDGRYSDRHSNRGSD